ncbi:MAG: hypothetical protein AB4368_26530 [Xenococcaceae cyanobacterium]
MKNKQIIDYLIAIAILLLELLYCDREKKIELLFVNELHIGEKFIKFFPSTMAVVLDFSGAICVL